MTEKEFQSSALQFLEKLFSDLKKNLISIPAHWDVDHLCYRVDSQSVYTEMKQAFSQFGQLLTESPVNGRLIATFRLKTPIVFKSWMITVVELPAPKEGKEVATGFEHIEVVCDVPFSELQTRYQHLNIDVRGLNKDLNQEFEIQLGERNLKFHHMSLESLIRLETNTRAWTALKSSNILQKFKGHSPLVAGTIPLGIQTDSSDLDILMIAEDLNEIHMKMDSSYERYPKYTAYRTNVNNLETLIVTFEYQEVPFEIFIQNKEPIRQQAYLHFLAEERLLKLSRGRLQKSIMEFRATKGLKTEPAFAQALRIVGNPYDKLLALQKAANHELLILLAALES